MPFSFVDKGHDVFLVLLSCSGQHVVVFSLVLLLFVWFSFSENAIEANKLYCPMFHVSIVI